MTFCRRGPAPIWHDPIATLALLFAPIRPRVGDSHQLSAQSNHLQPAERRAPVPPKRDPRRPRLRRRPSIGALKLRSPTRAPGFGARGTIRRGTIRRGTIRSPAKRDGYSLTRGTNADQRTRFPSTIHRMCALGSLHGAQGESPVPPYTRGSDSLSFSHPIHFVLCLHSIGDARRIPVFQLPRRVRQGAASGVSALDGNIHPGQDRASWRLSLRRSLQPAHDDARPIRIYYSVHHLRRRRPVDVRGRWVGLCRLTVSNLVLKESAWGFSA